MRFLDFLGGMGGFGRGVEGVGGKWLGFGEMDKQGREW